MTALTAPAGWSASPCGWTMKLPVWISVLTMLTVTTATAFEGLYPTAAERVAFGRTIAASPAS